MALVKHNKIKNTGIIFETLTRQVTSDILKGVDSKVINIIKKYFVNTELGKEYKLYETVFNAKNITEGKANTILETVLKASRNLNRTKLKNEKYNLIKELKESYDLDSIFRIKLDSYKRYAALYNLIELNAQPFDNSNVNQIIENKTTILEHLTNNKVILESKNELMEEFSSYDKDTRILTYRILMEKFNTKYNGLTVGQKRILKEYINCTDSTSQLKDFYNSEIKKLHALIEVQTPKIKSPSTKIKIQEIAKLMVEVNKNQTVKTDNLVDLLQYHSLIDELTKVNGKV